MKSMRLKLIIKKLTQSCPGSKSNKCNSNDVKEVSFIGNFNDFLVNFNVISASDILSIHKYKIPYKMFCFVVHCSLD